MTLPGNVLYVGLTLHLILAAPDFASTSVPQHTTDPPHKDPATPAQGVYNVLNENGTSCLKANMGLQINISFPSLNTTEQILVNINPNDTSSAGTCDSKNAILILNSGQNTELTFKFFLNTTSNKYHLSSVAIAADLPDMKGSFQAHNDSLDYLRSSLGFSYMCRSEQILQVSQNFSLNTFMLHVQPFGVTGDTFATAQECLLDEDDLIIPIVVGAALAGLVLVVLLAYLIGRKRSHAGYQTI